MLEISSPPGALCFLDLWKCNFISDGWMWGGGERCVLTVADVSASAMSWFGWNWLLRPSARSSAFSGYVTAVTLFGGMYLHFFKICEVSLQMMLSSAVRNGMKWFQRSRLSLRIAILMSFLKRLNSTCRFGYLETFQFLRSCILNGSLF